MKLDLSRLGDWGQLPFFANVLPGIEDALDRETREILPPRGSIFAALEAVYPDDVRVVILGQDPYPTPGHAHGFAFSASKETRPLPRSLANIYKEMRADVGAAPKDADLRYLADEGVLLLNTILTVPAGQPKGHAALGWQMLSTQIFARLSDGPRAYLLWGGVAQKAAAAVDSTQNLKIMSHHPVGMYGNLNFVGSRPFSRTNDWLQARGETAINWANK
ncbi:uracil-DNA glycosylase [Sulfitobacter sp. TSTF-M16]|uniref:Uracil-DNA glycosylase n=1 Tax=Sulfitobacter aestuariivivens TaxID=2766981 RepID=A0A927HE36_9RHOB|nr:uracil-DNA glycosylase [Sulfitobacter aestuariivivens]MBD3663476.1 uracil-DNA glycosylase [Sulfitobacter aestuariivivens]